MLLDGMVVMAVMVEVLMLQEGLDLTVEEEVEIKDLVVLNTMLVVFHLREYCHLEQQVVK